MQFSAAASKTVHVTLCASGLQWSTKWTGNALSIPTAACSQQLLRRNKLPIGCYFFSFLVFSPHDMNVFLTDLIVDNAVTHMQGFSSGIFIFFEKLCDQYEGIWNNMWLPCTVNVQHSTVFFTDFSLKQEVCATIHVFTDFRLKQ